MYIVATFVTSWPLNNLYERKTQYIETKKSDNYVSQANKLTKLKKEAPKPNELLHRMKEIMVTLDCDAKQALEIIKYENGN